MGDKIERASAVLQAKFTSGLSMVANMIRGPGGEGVFEFWLAGWESASRGWCMTWGSCWVDDEGNSSIIGAALGVVLVCA